MSLPPHKCEPLHDIRLAAHKAAVLQIDALRREVARLEGERDKLSGLLFTCMGWLPNEAKATQLRVAKVLSDLAPAAPAEPKGKP